MAQLGLVQLERILRLTLPLARVPSLSSIIQDFSGGQAGPGWPGEVPGLQNGARKTWFCGGMVSKMEIMGFPVTQMDCMVPRRPLGKPVSPKTLLKHCFPDFSRFSGNWGGPPWPPVDLLWALCGPVSYPTPDQPPVDRC